MLNFLWVGSMMKLSSRNSAALLLVVTTITVSLMALARFSLRSDADSWDGLGGAPLRIEARGSDRDWNFSYLGPDGTLDTADDIKSRGEMNLPVGAEVVINLRSDDFIYVFSCPDLGLKEIAVPDLEFSISFTAERPGEFNLLMDPMCGFRLPPGETMGRIKVAGANDFRQWLREH